jgi:ribose 5-phosphate isomerase A
MKWEQSIIGALRWSRPITNLEAKQEVASKIAAKVNDGDVIGFGSGSTSFLATQAIAASLRQRGISCTAIPTSAEVEFACMALGIPTTSLVNARPDWAFDGADEVDPQCNLIKGRGGAMFREKLLIDTCPKTFILVDPSKLVSELGHNFPIPIEVHPQAINYVTNELYGFGSREVELRLGLKKDGPVITENGNFILDARFPRVTADLEQRLRSITGVFESGLFIGRRVEILTPSACISK